MEENKKVMACEIREFFERLLREEWVRNTFPLVRLFFISALGVDARQPVSYRQPL